MNNYYRECLDSIRKYLAEGNTKKALAMIDEELSMPYVPEPFRSELIELQNEHRPRNQRSSHYFWEMDEIHRALLGDETLQAKALVSLEHMNLHGSELELQEIFAGGADESIKRLVLMVASAQKIDYEFTISLDNQIYQINPKTIKNPFESEKYVQVCKELEKRYGDDNPSLLTLSLQVLDRCVLENYPFIEEHLSSETIAQTVASYFESN